MGTIPYEPYDAALLSPLAPGCRIIVSASAGYNEFDTDWMTSQDIIFCNTVSAVSEATADMTVFLILATLRNTSVAEAQARSGKWKAGLTPSRDPVGKVLGIIGLGSIGKHVVRKARVFGMSVAYHNRTRLDERLEQNLSVEYCESLEALLAKADVVSLHTPLNANTTNLSGKKELALMKDGAVLINTARGAVVDQEAMIESLETGSLSCAGLDVFPNEPQVDERLRKCTKVVLQPHMGGLTESAFARSQWECLENIRAYFETGVPNSPVNQPTR